MLKSRVETGQLLWQRDEPHAKTDISHRFAHISHSQVLFLAKRSHSREQNYQQSAFPLISYHKSSHKAVTAGQPLLPFFY